MSGHKEPNPSSGSVRRPKPPTGPPSINQPYSRREEEERIFVENCRALGQAICEFGEAMAKTIAECGKQINLSIQRSQQARQARIKRERDGQRKHPSEGNHVSNQHCEVQEYGKRRL